MDSTKTEKPATNGVGSDGKTPTPTTNPTATDKKDDNAMQVESTTVSTKDSVAPDSKEEGTSKGEDAVTTTTTKSESIKKDDPMEGEKVTSNSNDADVEKKAAVGETVKLEYKVGSIVYKRFEDDWFFGHVTKIFPREGLFHVLYEDGDEEDLFEKEMDEVAVVLDNGEVAQTALLPQDDTPKDEKAQTKEKSQEMVADVKTEKEEVNKKDEKEKATGETTAKEDKSEAAKDGEKPADVEKGEPTEKPDDEAKSEKPDGKASGDNGTTLDKKADATEVRTGTVDIISNEIYKNLDRDFLEQYISRRKQKEEEAMEPEEPVFPRFSLGTIIYKCFKTEWFFGHVARINSDSELYGVLYEDGDKAELSEDEMLDLVVVLGDGSPVTISPVPEEMNEEEWAKPAVLTKESQSVGTVDIISSNELYSKIDRESLAAYIKDRQKSKKGRPSSRSRAGKKTDKKTKKSASGAKKTTKKTTTTKKRGRPSSQSSPQKKRKTEGTTQKKSTPRSKAKK